MKKAVWLRDALDTCSGTTSREMLEPYPSLRLLSVSVLAWDIVKMLI